MFSLSFKLSTAVPALLSVFSNKSLATFSGPTINSASLDSFPSENTKRIPCRPRISVHEIMARFTEPETSAPSPTQDTPVSDHKLPHFRIPARRTVNSRATVMDVAARFDEAHVNKPSTVRGAEVKNALSRIIANANEYDPRSVSRC